MEKNIIVKAHYFNHATGTAMPIQYYKGTDPLRAAQAVLTIMATSDDKADNLSLISITTDFETVKEN